MFLQTLVEVVY